MQEERDLSSSCSTRSRVTQLTWTNTQRGRQADRQAKWDLTLEKRSTTAVGERKKERKEGCFSSL